MSSNKVHGPNDRLCNELTYTNSLYTILVFSKREQVEGIYIINVNGIKNTCFRVQLHN